MAPTDFITRVVPPRARPDLVQRSRLLNQLHSAASRKVTLIHSPAGYGKTSLLAQFKGDVEIPVCWVSLDQSDQDPMKLIQDIVASVTQQFPFFAERAGIDTEEAHASGAGWQNSLVAVLNSTYKHIPEIFILVLDDFHHAEDNPEVTQLVLSQPNCWQDRDGEA